VNFDARSNEGGEFQEHLLSLSWRRRKPIDLAGGGRRALQAINRDRNQADG
jgi:hypothetical protein